MNNQYKLKYKIKLLLRGRLRDRGSKIKKIQIETFRNLLRINVDFQNFMKLF